MEALLLEFMLVPSKLVGPSKLTLLFKLWMRKLRKRILSEEKITKKVEIPRESVLSRKDTTPRRGVIPRKDGEIEGWRVCISTELTRALIPSALLTLHI
jgi:hypothetical protein